jgi:hypothetical protein
MSCPSNYTRYCYYSYLEHFWVAKLLAQFSLQFILQALLALAWLVVQTTMFSKPPINERFLLFFPLVDEAKMSAGSLPLVNFVVLQNHCKLQEMHFSSAHPSHLLP